MFGHKLAWSKANYFIFKISVVYYIFKRDSSYKAAVFIYSLLDNRHDQIFGYKKGNEIKNVFQTEKLF